MVDPDRLRRLIGLLERYRALPAEDLPDPFRRRQTRYPSEAMTWAARSMVRLAGARNVIVRFYVDVDDELLARAVAEGGLDDLDAFARRIAALVT